MEFNNQKLTFEDVREQGINISNIKVCKQLRRLAKLDRLSLDETTHRSGLNKHLFDYLEYCGMEPLDFIKQYLSNIQPYMIERRHEQEPEKTYRCVIDNLYRVSIYIKVDTKQYEEVVVSFHEDNIRGVARTNDLQKIDNEKYVLIFADSELAHIEGQNRYVIKSFFQRGMLVLPIELNAVKCEDMYIIEKRAINLAFVGYCNDYIRDLYSSNLDLDFEQITVFSMLQQISFTSYGKDTFSSMSLLIDSLCVQKDYVSKKVADFALITFSQNLQLTGAQKAELCDLLETKFKVTSIRGIDIILERIKENIGITENGPNDDVIEEKN